MRNMRSEKRTYHIVSRGSVSDRAIAFATLSWEASKRTTTLFLHRAVAMKEFCQHLCKQRERFEIRFGLKFRDFELGRTVRQTIEATLTRGTHNRKRPTQPGEQKPQ